MIECVMSVVHEGEGWELCGELVAVPRKDDLVWLHEHRDEDVLAVITKVGYVAWHLREPAPFLSLDVEEREWETDEPLKPCACEKDD